MIEVVKTKELKSSTKVEGIMVLMSNGEWYAITRMMPPRSPWFLRGSLSSRTGKISMTDIFMKSFASKPDLDEGIIMLTNVLNGETPSKERLIV
jgi:hypothetical protein